jgi:hypothetical protein
MAKARGKWRTNSQTWTDLEVAHFWNLRPSEFWESSDEDKLYMTAYMLSKYEIKAVEDLILQKEIEKNKQKKGRK